MDRHRGGDFLTWVWDGKSEPWYHCGRMVNLIKKKSDSILWEFDALGHKGRRREGTHGVERVSEIKPCEHHVCPRGTSKRLVLPIHMVTREHFTWHSGNGVGGCTCTCLHAHTSLARSPRHWDSPTIVSLYTKNSDGSWANEKKK